MRQRLKLAVHQALCTQRARQAHTQASCPTSLSQFDINTSSPLGAGAHATVYWGRHRTSKKDVAIKMMSPRVCSATANWLVVSRCIRKETRVFDELLTTGKMHPNVADVISRFVSPGKEATQAGISLPDGASKQPVSFFITEFLGGGSLADEIRRREEAGALFHEHEVLAVAQCVSDGLRFLHAQGVTHRDVKPENLIYSKSREQIKLIDFSLAEIAPKVGAESAFHDRNVGTRGFMAPEILMDSEEGHGPRCDVFSFGCVLYRMLTGKLPHVDLENVCVIACLPQALTVKTRRLIDSMLATNPMDRPTSAEVYEACSRLVGGPNVQIGA